MDDEATDLDEETQNLIKSTLDKLMPVYFNVIAESLEDTDEETLNHRSSILQDIIEGYFDSNSESVLNMDEESRNHRLSILKDLYEEYLDSNSESLLSVDEESRNNTLTILRDIIKEYSDYKVELQEDDDIRRMFTEISKDFNVILVKMKPIKSKSICDQESQIVRLRILSALLLNKELSVREIAEICGNNGTEGTDYSFVSRLLRELEDEYHYLCSETRTFPRGIGRPPRYYQIKPDITTLQTLYHKAEFQSLSSDFPRSLWIADLIIDTHFECAFHDHRALITRMLKASRSFFEYGLTSEVSVEDLYYRLLEFDAAYPVGSSDQPSDSPDYPPIDILLYHFFRCCAFADECRPDVQMYPFKSVRLGNEAQERMTLYRHDYEEANITTAFITGMQELISRCTPNQTGEYVVPAEIIRKFEEYSIFLRRYQDSESPNPDLIDEIGKICDEIMDLMAPLCNEE